MSIAYVVLALLACGIAAYFFASIKRAFATWGRSLKKPLHYVFVAVLCLVIGILAVQITHISALFVLHFMIFHVAIQGIYRLIHLFLKSKSVAWERIIACGCIPALLTCLVILGGYYNLQNVQVTQYTVHTSKSIRAEGYRVVLLADLHYGVSLDDDELIRLCTEISAQDVDIVVLCGDIVDDATTKAGLESVFRILGNTRSRYGVFYTYGNHDRPFRGNADQLYETIQQNGITILCDETYTINQELVLVGREDKGFSGHSNRADISTLLANVDHDDFILTLDHQPCEYAENNEAGTNLLLSGHTHGGQIWPLDWLQEIVPFNDGVYGRYDISENTTAIITSGVAGWRVPLKTAAPAEYVIVDILPQNG